jgi:hypothetical protein
MAPWSIAICRSSIDKLDAMRVSVEAVSEPGLQVFWDDECASLESFIVFVLVWI